MKELIMVGKILVYVFVLILALFQVANIIDNISNNIHMEMNDYVDCRIRVIVKQHQDMIYEDLATLHPTRVTWHHGRVHVK